MPDAATADHRRGGRERSGLVLPARRLDVPRFLRLGATRDVGRPRRRRGLHRHRGPHARRAGAARARRGARIARGLAAADRDARGRRGGVDGGVRRHRQGGGAGAGRFAGRGVALRVRRDGDRGRRLERSSASVRGRAPAGRSTSTAIIATRPGDRPSREDRGLRRSRRHDRRRRARRSGSARRRRPDRRRRRGLGCDGGRCGGRRAPARPHRGSARGVHGAGRHDDLKQREPAGACPAGGRAGRAAARGDAGRPRRPAAPRCLRRSRDEVGVLLGVDAAHMARYELDGTATGVAAWSLAGDHKPVGTRVNTEGESIVGLVLRTGRPARIARLRECVRPCGRTGPGAGPALVGRRSDRRRPAPLGRDDRLIQGRPAARLRTRSRGSPPSPSSSRRRSRTPKRGRIWRRRGRASWRRPTTSAGVWFAICTTVRSSGWSTRSSP